MASDLEKFRESIFRLEEPQKEYVSKDQIEILRLKNALKDKVNNVEDWMEKPNLLLDNLAPKEIIDKGHIDQIWKLIYTNIDLREKNNE